VHRFDEVVPKVRFLFEEVSIDPEAREKVLAKDGADAALRGALDALSSADWTAAAIEESLRTVPEGLGMKPKAVFQAIRVAVTGTTVSPPLFESLELLGRETALERIQDALDSLAG
jgi:glutamyl-tRNA synthetase